MKKINYKHTGLLFVFSLLCCGMVMVSCSEWDEFKKYTNDGEIVYTGKFDSVVVFPGKERVRFWGTIAPDPKVKRAKVFWDNRADSVEFDVDGTGSTAAFDRIFDVAEGTKSFTVYTYDNEGHSSIGVTFTGNSYGSRYRNTLSNRKIKSVVYDDVNTVILWDLVDRMLGPVQMEVRYETPRGDTLVITPATETQTVLKDLDYANKTFSWRTVFKPLPVVPGVVCIDTFQTRSAESTIPTFVEKELDRSMFAAVSLAGDTPNNGGSGGIASMWDGGAQNNYGQVLFTDIGTGGSSPQMVTVDLGLNVDLTKLIIYPFKESYGYYVFSTLRDYEIYGSANPSSNGSLDASWSLLASGTFEKISGGGASAESAEDVAAAIAGFSVPVDPAVTKVRYIRIRCLRNYDAFFNSNSKAFFSVAELRVFGMLPE
jgi:hypothetical protein